MATTLTPTYPLITIRLRTPDFTVLADNCDRAALTLIDSDNVYQHPGLYDRLKESLSLLRPTLNEPIPAHLIHEFIADVLPDSIPRFEPDAETLCEYCLALVTVLNERSLLSETENTLRGLLCELVWFFAGELKAPRWVRGEENIEPITH